MKKQIPNIITSLNLLCGITAIIFVLAGDLVTASFFVFAGIFFDFFDGFFARLLHAQSEIGLQLDSLADMVTSGVVPALVMVQLLSIATTGTTIDMVALMHPQSWNDSVFKYLPFIGFIIAIASAYRLAKFNVDTRQTSGFIGLPTPANTLLILSLPLILEYQPSELASQIILNKWFLIFLTVLSAILLNAEIKLFALKFKTWQFKENATKYIFLAVSILLVIALKFVAIPLIIGVYLFLSMISKK
jgi:CDP-diacylglycerol--serine O-phosphatidyltransferase